MKIAGTSNRISPGTVRARLAWACLSLLSSGPCASDDATATSRPAAIRLATGAAAEAQATTVSTAATSAAAVASAAATASAAASAAASARVAGPRSGADLGLVDARAPVRASTADASVPAAGEAPRDRAALGRSILLAVGAGALVAWGLMRLGRPVDAGPEGTGRGPQ